MFADAEVASIAEGAWRKAIARLSKYKTKHNVLTYDGSLLDKLAYFFVSTVLQPSEFEVICSIRPCMDATLRNSVQDFAQSHGYRLIGYDEDCVVDYANMQIIEHRCGNVESAIRERLSGTDGLLILGSMTNENSRRVFKTMQDWYDYEHGDHDLVFKGEADNPSGWKTILLFEDFYAQDILIGYMSFVSTAVSAVEMPACYIPCYYEDELQKLRFLDARCRGILAERCSSQAVKSRVGTLRQMLVRDSAL